MIMMHKTKGMFQLKWEGSFVAETVYSDGAYRVSNPNGDTYDANQQQILEEILSMIKLTLYL